MKRDVTTTPRISVCTEAHTHEEVLFPNKQASAVIAQSIIHISMSRLVCVGEELVKTQRQHTFKFFLTFMIYVKKMFLCMQNTNHLNLSEAAVDTAWFLSAV